METEIMEVYSLLTCLLLTRIALRVWVVVDDKEPVAATGVEEEDEATSVWSVWLRQKKKNTWIFLKYARNNALQSSKEAINLKLIDQILFIVAQEI